MERSRRTFVTSSLSVLAVGTLAGCAGEDPDEPAGTPEPESTPEPTPESESHSVTLLVEGVGGDGYDDDHDDDHDDEGLDEHAIEHACGHMQFDDTESIEGGSSGDDAPVIHATHQPFDVTVEDDGGYVVFEVADDHDDDHDDDNDDDHDDRSRFGFFTHGGTVEVVDGHADHEEHGVEGCDDIDTYAVAEPHDGKVTLRVSAD